MAKGENREDITVGLCDSIADRIATMVRRVGFKEEVIMTGRVAKNWGVVKLLENKLEINIFIPEEPQIIGALGAALEAQEDILEI